MSVLMLFFIAFLLFTQTHGHTPEITIRSAGATLPAPLYSSWQSMYGVLKEEVRIEYSPTGSVKGKQSIMNDNPSNIFVGTDSPFDEMDVQQFPHLRAFPMVVSAVVCPFNIHLVNSSLNPLKAPPNQIAGDPYTGDLVLDRSTVAGIFVGDITQWNDPAIARTNPSIAEFLPQSPITVVIRRDASGTTKLFTTALSSFSSKWRNSIGIVEDWTVGNITGGNLNNTLALQNKFISAPGNGGVYSAVQFYANSIGYSAFPFVKRDSGQYAKMITAANLTVDIDDLDAIGAQSDNMIDLPGAWPILGFSYIGFNLNENFNNSNCEEKRETLKWMNWVLTDPNAQERTNELGYVNLDTNLRDIQLKFLKQIQCNGQILLQELEVPQHQSPAFEVFLAVAMVLLIASSILGGYHIYSNKKKQALIYSIVLVIGADLTYFSVIFWYLVPTQTWICQLRIWFLSIGLTFLLGGVFSRAWQLHRVYVDYQNQNLSGRMISSFAIACVVATIVILQLIIMATWSGSDPYSAQRVFSSSIDLEVVWKCDSNYGLVWIAIEIAFFGLTILWGIFVVYRTWALRTLGNRGVGEARWLLISIYNMVIVASIVIPMGSTLVLDDEGNFFLVVLPLLFATSQFIFTVTIPALLFHRKKETKENLHDISPTKSPSSTSENS